MLCSVAEVYCAINVEKLLPSIDKASEDNHMLIDKPPAILSHNIQYFKQISAG